MNNIKNQDERVLAQRRKIQSDGFQLLIYGLLLAIVVQQFFLQAPPSQFMGEFLCLIAAGFYNLIRNLKLGNGIFVDKKGSYKRLLKNAMFSGIGTIILTIILTGKRDIKDILIFFLTFTISYGLMVFGVYYLSKKKEEKIQKELDMDEDDIN